MRARSTSADAFLNLMVGESKSASRFLSATVKCSASIPMVHFPDLFRFAHAASSHSPSEPFKQSFARNVYFRALHLGAALRVITHVGKKDTASSLDQQETGAPGEAAKISNVRKVAD